MGAMADISEISWILNGLVRWKFPLNECPGIPINHHPGAFGFHRKKNHHTGVDLYCKNDTKVHAVEDGVIVHIDQFTGAALGHTWWNDTWGVMIEGSSGVVNYGELNIPKKQVGERVKRGDLIGNVKQVLFDDRLRPDIDGHSCSMLHLELYKHGTRSFADWHDPQKNPSLLDPTPYLMNSENCPLRTLTWANSESKKVG
ncbi:MAG: M23 family metallopeptidase [bacterium]